MALEIKGKTQSLRWLADLLSFFQAETIKVPTDYRNQVIKTKQLLENDVSGIVGTMLDFAIQCALVDYRIETPNANLTEELNNWLKKVNLKINTDEGVKSIPTGLESLAKEYFRERWKGSSNLLLRTFWDKQNNLQLPTTLFFIDGEDIKVKSKKGKQSAVILGEEKYYLRINDAEKDDIKLPRFKEEMIFVQRPYESWSNLIPIPFLIRRGLFHNMSFHKLMSSKGEFIVGKALEYLFVMKKGSEKMTIEGRAELTYSEEDLKKVSKDLQNLIQKKKSESGLPGYVTGFDTEISEYIPDYKKALDAAIYSPIEKRLLSGLGLIEIIQGTASTRRESVLNPKPFVSEIKSGIKDFKTLLRDIIQIIIEKNSKSHPKWMGAEIKIVSSPVKEFITQELRTMLRSIYDRGGLSKRTLVEVAGEQDFDVEVQYRKTEKKEGLDKALYPPVILNVEKDIEPKKPVSDDKKSIEKKNFLQALEEAECPHCKEIFDFESQEEIEVGKVKCPNCHKGLTRKELLKLEEAKIFEEAPYTNKNYPPQLKNLPAGARSIWIDTFNSVYKQTKNETQARQASWRNVKLRYKKSGDSWVRKSKGEFEESLQQLPLDDIIELKKLDVLNKQSKILDRLIKEEAKDETTD